MTAETATLQREPVSGTNRYEALDVLRGIAVMGIFAINMWFFAQPESFYINPTSIGPLEGIDKTIWTAIYFLVAFKFITLFSMMFGGGIAMMAERAGGGVHVRRMLWLLLFGLIHAYVIWPGDVLVTYAICGLLITGARHWSPRGLMIFAAVMLGIGAALSFLLIAIINLAPDAEEIAAEVSAQVWAPGARAHAAEIAARLQPSFLAQIPINIEQALFFQTQGLLSLTLWRTLGVMALGMAFFKWGILTGQRSMLFYAITMVLGFGLGGPMVWQAIAVREASGWDFVQVMSVGEQWNYWGSLGMAMGWLGLIMLFAKSGLIGWKRKMFAATGRMAFTNYIMQSVIATAVFYGWGLGLFGSFSFLEMLYMTLAVWLLQMLWSPLWLSRFQYGPLEWVWRSLTYGRAAPLVKRAAQ